MKTIREMWRLMVFGGVVAGAMAWLVFMVADNTPPYEYDVPNSFIVPISAVGGDQITVKWKLNKVNRICPGSNRRVLFDPQTRVILATYDATPPATSSSLSEGYLNRTFLLPRGLLPVGDIGYRAHVCYECNLFQKFVRPLCVTTPELTFRVREP